MATANANKVDTQPIRLRPGQQGMLAGVASLLSAVPAMSTAAAAGCRSAGQARALG
jgi:hypothetical protein